MKTRATATAIYWAGQLGHGAVLQDRCVCFAAVQELESGSASVKQGPVAVAALRNDNLFLILDEIKLYRVSAKVMKNNEYIWRLTLLHYTLCSTGKLLC